jgi:hypothetical protein
MAKLKKHGKGIVLMHDFQHATAQATADLLKDLIQALDRRAHHCLAQSLDTHYGPALQRCTPLPLSEELAGAIRSAWIVTGWVSTICAIRWVPALYTRQLVDLLAAA